MMALKRGLHLEGVGRRLFRCDEKERGRRRREIICRAPLEESNELKLDEESRMIHAPQADNQALPCRRFQPAKLILASTSSRFPPIGSRRTGSSSRRIAMLVGREEVDGRCRRRGEREDMTRRLLPACHDHLFLKISHHLRPLIQHH